MLQEKTKISRHRKIRAAVIFASYLAATFAVLAILAAGLPNKISDRFASSADPEDGGTTTPAASQDKCDRTQYVCFATMTERMCQIASGDDNAKLDAGVCKIVKDKYTFAGYLKAWISAYLLKIGLAISLILIMTAGVLYMFSGTDPGKATLAKDLIITTLSGLIFLFLAETIFGWIVR